MARQTPCLAPVGGVPEASSVSASAVRLARLGAARTGGLKGAVAGELVSRSCSQKLS